MMSEAESRNVSVCGVPFLMSIVDGGVLFSSKHGFYGVTERYMFERKSSLWYLVDIKATFKAVAVSHIVKMHELIGRFISEDHEPERDGDEFVLCWKREVAGNREDLNSGVWFQSAVSGLWYRNHRAAGSISAVIVDGLRLSCSKEVA